MTEIPLPVTSKIAEAVKGVASAHVAALNEAESASASALSAREQRLLSLSSHLEAPLPQTGSNERP